MRTTVGCHPDFAVDLFSKVDLFFSSSLQHPHPAVSVHLQPGKHWGWTGSCQYYGSWSWHHRRSPGCTAKQVNRPCSIPYHWLKIVLSCCEIQSLYLLVFSLCLPAVDLRVPVKSWSRLSNWPSLSPTTSSAWSRHLKWCPLSSRPWPNMVAMATISSLSWPSIFTTNMIQRCLAWQSSCSKGWQQ